MSDLMKQLKNQLKGINAEIEIMKSEISLKQKECNIKITEKNRLEERIYQLTPKDIKISDHALLRYFERVKGYSLDEIKKEILSPKIKEFNTTLGDGTFPNDEGFTIVIRDNVVVTVVK